MKFPRIRFTLRQLILAVAIAAILIFGEGMRRRREHFLSLAGKFGRYEKDSTILVDMYESNEFSHHQIHDLMQRRVKELEPGPVRELFQEQIANYTRMIAEDRRELPKLKTVVMYEMGLRLKYERAARLPWLLVPPDPPRPR